MSFAVIMSEEFIMQTLIINIQDGFIQDFLSIVEHYKGKIQIQKDIAGIDSGKIEMLSQEQYDKVTRVNILTQ